MTMSARAIKALMGITHEEVLIWLLTFSHPEMDEDLRVCSESADVVSRGHTFMSYPFEIAWAPDDDRPARVSIRISNTDSRIWGAIRSLSSPPEMKMELVLADTPDIVEASVSHLELRSAKADAIQITGDLTHRRYNQEPWPKQSFTPQAAPALYQ